MPNSGDVVVIGQPGVAVSVTDSEAAGTLTVPVSVAANPPTLAISGVVLSLGSGSEIDGGFQLTSGVLYLTGNTTLTGTSAWSGGAIDLNGHTLFNTGTWAISVGASGYPGGVYGASSTSGGGGNQGGTLHNQGTIEQASGNVQTSDGVTILNEATYEFTGDAAVSQLDNNQGQMTHDATSTFGNLQEALLVAQGSRSTRPIATQ